MFVMVFLLLLDFVCSVCIVADPLSIVGRTSVTSSSNVDVVTMGQQRNSILNFSVNLILFTILLFKKTRVLYCICKLYRSYISTSLHCVVFLSRFHIWIL